MNTIIDYFATATKEAISLVPNIKLREELTMLADAQTEYSRAVVRSVTELPKLANESLKELTKPFFGNFTKK